jgi:hypothetical protein
MEQRQNEWDLLQTDAMLLLEKPDKYLFENRSKRNPAIRIWHYPSFEQHYSWTIYKPAPLEPLALYQLQEISWDRAQDYARMHNPLNGVRHALHFAPVPTINVRMTEISSGELARDEIDTRIDSLSNLHLKPFIQDRPWGLDGEPWGVELFAFGGMSRLEWWCEGPQEWRELVDWTASTIQKFRDLLANETSVAGRIGGT